MDWKRASLHFPSFYQYQILDLPDLSNCKCIIDSSMLCAWKPWHLFPLIKCRSLVFPTSPTSSLWHSPMRLSAASLKWRTWSSWLFSRQNFSLVYWIFIYHWALVLLWLFTCTTRQPLAARGLLCCLQHTFLSHKCLLPSGETTLHFQLNSWWQHWCFSQQLAAAMPLAIFNSCKKFNITRAASRQLALLWLGCLIKTVAGIFIAL